MSSNVIAIGAATPDEFDRAAECWLAMRREIGGKDADLAPDWRARSIAYFKRRSESGELRWFVARDGGEVVATAAGLLLENYPSICFALRTGYIAGVYVVPAYRKRGLGFAVTKATVEWLRTLGCRRIRLHAADRARPMYEALGFAPTNEMLLEQP